MVENINYKLDKKIELAKYGKISFLFAYSLFAFYFLINGEGILYGWDSTRTYTTIVYLCGVSLFLGIQSKLPKDLEAPVIESLRGFCLSFLIATVLFIFLKDFGILFSNIDPIPVKQILGNFIYQLVIVCVSEEIIFRVVIYRYIRNINLKVSFYFAVFFSAIVFSLFHLVAYNFNISSMFIAFIMGIILALCVERWNVGVSIGGHFAWNCMVLGITAIIKVPGII